MLLLYQLVYQACVSVFRVLLFNKYDKTRYLTASHTLLWRALVESNSCVTQAVAVATILAPTENCHDVGLAWSGALRVQLCGREKPWGQGIVAMATAWADRGSVQPANSTRSYSLLAAKSPPPRRHGQRRQRSQSWPVPRGQQKTDVLPNANIFCQNLPTVLGAHCCC